MSKLKIKESAQLAEAKGDHRRIRLITEGQGSSGLYEAKMLESCGPSAFPSGTFLYFNHENPESRDIRDAFGVTTEDAAFEEDSKGLWSTARIFETHKTFINDIAPYADLSIEAAGEIDEDGTVTEITPDPFNAVALVPRGGRDGKIAEILESAQYANVVHNETQRKDAGMTPEDIQKIVEALTAALASEFTKITEALKPAEPVVEEKAEVDPIEVATEVAEALVAADLPKSARTKVLEAVKAGKTVAEAITAETQYIAELKAEAPSQGRVVETKTSEIDFSVGAWN